MGKNLLIITSVIAAIFFILLAISFSLSTKTFQEGNKNENLVETREINLVLIEIKEAEKELNRLRELAEDQESLAKIDLIFEKLNYYKKELKKPPREIKKEIIGEFYNSGIWQEILAIKSKIEPIKKSIPVLE